MIRQKGKAKENSHCLDFHEKGHWAGDKECKRPGAGAAARKKLESKRRVKNKKRRKRVECFAVMVADDFAGNEDDVLITRLSAVSDRVEGALVDNSEELVGILDSGCQLTVMGMDTFREWEEVLARAGMPLPARVPSRQGFRFGNGGRLRAAFVAYLHLTIGGKSITLRTHVVAGATPFLLSKKVHKDLALTVDHRR